MAFLQPGSLLLVLGVLLVVASMSCATPIDISGPDAGLAGRKLLSEVYGSPQPKSPIHDNPLLQFSTEKIMCGTTPCFHPSPHPSPVPVHNGETVVFSDGNNAWEVNLPGGKKPHTVMPPCQVGACDQALTNERDFVGRHIGQAVADELNVGAHHIHQVEYPQSGPAPFPDSYDHPLPAAWSLDNVLCKCPDPTYTCYKGFCIEPPYVDSVNKGFYREGAVLP